LSHATAANAPNETPQQQQQDKMSHDLHFDVHSADGTLQGSMDDANESNITTTPSSSSRIALSQSSHPIACIFHCFFKLAALVLYIFGGYFSTNKYGKSSGAKFITVSVFLILLLAADFWVVKNITGRLLVGLRWWNQVEGESTRWIFESAPNRAVNKFDHSVFWTVLYMTPVAWACLFMIGLLKLEIGWLLTVCMALALSGANVYGYYKCSSDQKAKFQQMMQQGAQAGAMSMIRSNLFGFLASTATGNHANTNAPNASATYV
jgi:hypothetical protein